MKKYNLYLLVLNEGVASKYLQTLKDFGFPGGTIIQAQRTSKSKLTRFLGLDREKKEVIISIAAEEIGSNAINIIQNDRKLAKRFKGIGAVIPIDDLLGVGQIKLESIKKENSVMSNKVVFIIVNRGLAEDVVEIATNAGATGGTIINARGAGSQVVAKFFGIEIEPEKEIVMIICHDVIKERIVKNVYEQLGLDKPNTGIIFVIDAKETFGLDKESLKEI